jgi:hypothetical protein
MPHVAPEKKVDLERRRKMGRERERILTVA